MNFDAFVQDIQDNRWNVYGVEVYQDGQLCHPYGGGIPSIPPPGSSRPSPQAWPGTRAAST